MSLRVNYIYICVSHFRRLIILGQLTNIYVGNRVPRFYQAPRMSDYGGFMRVFVFIAALLVSPMGFASWSEDFQEIKNTPRNYTDAGAICEELAKVQFEKEYNKKDFEVVVGIAYGDGQRTIGELDVVVFDRNSKSAVKVTEVKCWADLSGGLHKAHLQRARFLANIDAKKPIYFKSTATLKSYPQDVFKDVTVFTTLGQKGSVQAGYDAELEYDLNELHRLSSEMIRCQNQGVCARPAHSTKKKTGVSFLEI
jgi:hypothetical protein